ncbi:Superoxide dismutase [Mn], mitochondrial [Neochlamydia sp. EPS4]|nr:Superoxide dismutase [Mn], mitochondrial [Neochlamydia sp. EPS4]
MHIFFKLQGVFFMAFKYQLPPLPYDFGDLEPVISAEIMNLHYTKHHQTYVNNLNKALEQYEEAQGKAEKSNDPTDLIALQSAIKFNGGGHINHSIFWTNLAPKSQGGGTVPDGDLQNAIKKDFDSWEKFIEEFSARTVAIQGSGWGWLGYCKQHHRLQITTCENQDPLSPKGLIPLLGIDVWEHAYYLQYKNVRAEYVKNIWEIVNWKNVEERYKLASAAKTT